MSRNETIDINNFEITTQSGRSMKFLIFVLPLILFAQNHQFRSSIIINDDPPGTYFHATTQRSIACRGDTVYLVWRDDRYGSPLWWGIQGYSSKKLLMQGIPGMLI